MKNYRSYVILAVAIIIASFYRFFNLGSTSLWVDEYYHVFASKNILSGLGPLLPSGLNYTVGLPFTFMVTISRALLGGSTFAARLPSAFFGVLLIPTVYFLLRKVINEKAALTVAVLIAFDPFSFWWSRIGRMYTMFELFFFVSAFLLFYLLTDLSFNKKNIKLWAVFIVLFGLTVSLHNLGVVLPVAAAIFVLAAYVLKLNKRSYLLASFAVIIIIVAFVYLYLSKSFTPSRYYVNVFYKLNPLFLLLVFTTFGYSVWKKKTFGVFAGTLFFTAFLIHSLFFPDWTHSRYMLYSVPFAYVVLAVPFGDFMDSLVKGESETTKNIVTAFSVLVVVIFGKSMVAQSYGMSMTTFPDYKKAIERINKESAENIVISTLPVATTHYYGKTDYYLRSKNYNRYVFKKKGKVVEIYTGAELLNNSDKLKDVTLRNKDVWIFAESRLYKYNDEDIRRTINEYYKPVYIDRSYQITLFRKKQ